MDLGTKARCDNFVGTESHSYEAIILFTALNWNFWLRKFLSSSSLVFLLVQNETDTFSYHLFLLDVFISLIHLHQNLEFGVCFFFFALPI